MNNTETAQRCPGCSRIPEELILHHWGHQEGNSIMQDRYYSIETSQYKYICNSCNSRLGKIYARRDPPTSWEEQLTALQKDLNKPLHPKDRVPYITCLEGSIFFLFAKDTTEAKKETVREFLKIQEPKSTSRGLLSNKCRVICMKNEVRPYEITKSDIFYGKRPYPYSMV